MSPPVAPRRTHERVHHGDTFSDPYEWMRDTSDPAVLAHLEAENAYTDAMTGHLAGLRERIFNEIRSRVQETDLSVPVRHHRWWYYSRTQEGQQYPIHARVPIGASQERPALEAAQVPEGEEILLDGNVEADGQEFFALGALDVSPDGDRLAYAVDRNGDERFDLVITDLARGVRLDEGVRGIGYGVAWARDGQHLFYTRVDDAWRPYQVWRHRVGEPADSDVLVFQEDDERYWMGLEVSRDERWIMIAVGSKNTTEFRILPADDPEGDFQVVASREEGIDYLIEPAGQTLWIVHDKNHQDSELARAPVGSTHSQQWQTVIPGEDGQRVQMVEAFASHLVISMRRHGLAEVHVCALDDNHSTGVAPGFDIPAHEEVYTVTPGSTPDFHNDHVQVVIGSLVTPASVYDVDMNSGEKTLLKRQPVLGDYDPEDYAQHRLWATAADGQQIPISLVARKDVTPDGSAPGLLYGYGSYEVSVDPAFSVKRLSLLDRGAVYAIAHVRGGGEMGRSWYTSGRREHKTNTFTDFVTCGRFLIETGWVAPDRLAAEGGSAGGLLMGAAVNLAPDLFCAVHAAVPFVDTLTTILKPELPLTIGEWEEWGNPLESADIYQLMRSYSPYENIQSTEYPAILATSGLNDTRVYVVEPAKWIAALRQQVTNDPAERPILMRTEMVAGHGGKTGRYDAWRESAFELAFLLDQLGLAEA